VLRPRIIPCLLIHKGGLVKTVNFKNPKYVGDPINAVKIFNEKEADELIVLDIDASVNNSEPNYRLISNLANECRMPICYGGGIKNAAQARKIIGLGVEKIAISSAAIENPDFIKNVSNEIGAQSVVVVLDVRRKNNDESSPFEVFTHGGAKRRKGALRFHMDLLADCPVGEIMVNNIDRDGLMSGYDIELGKQLKNVSTVPVSMLGGAGSVEDVSELLRCCGHIGCAAGSLFVFKGPLKAVLLTYPTLAERLSLFRNALMK